MICPVCKSPTVSSIEGSSLVIECPECGWSIATTYTDPVYEDEAVYTITMGEGNAPTKELLKVVSSIAGVNYIAAKRIIETPGAFLAQGSAVDVRDAIKKLSDFGASFGVDPDFPYD